MSNETDGGAAKFARAWKVAHAPLSWALGAGLLIFVTVTGAGHQSPEWYPIIGGLLGGPFLTIWNEGRKNKPPKETAE